MHRFSAETAYNFIRPGGTGLPVAAQLNFNQFMMIQSRFNLSHHVFAQSLVSNHDNGLEVMGQAPEVAELTVAKLHVLLPDGVNWD